jgi:hypothetical protein
MHLGLENLGFGVIHKKVGHSEKKETWRDREIGCWGDGVTKKRLKIHGSLYRGFKMNSTDVR